LSQIKTSQHAPVLAGFYLVWLTVMLSRIRLRAWRIADTCQKHDVPYLECPILVTLPPLAYHFTAWSNSYVIFSQEKPVFFEQIQPMGVTHYISTSAKAPAFALLACHGWQRLGVAYGCDQFFLAITQEKKADDLSLAFQKPVDAFSNPRHRNLESSSSSSSCSSSMHWDSVTAKRPMSCN